MTWAGRAVRVLVRSAVIYLSGQAVRQATGYTYWGIGLSVLTMIAVCYILIASAENRRRRRNGRHRKAAAAGGPGAVPGLGAGARGRSGGRAGARARAGARVSNPPPCTCPACAPCGCGLCVSQYWHVYNQAAPGPVAQSFWGAARYGCAGQHRDWNAMAEMNNFRYRMVTSDELGDGYPWDRANISAALSYIAARHATLPDPGHIARQMGLYASVAKLRLLTGSAPPSFAPGGPVVSGSGYARGGSPAAPGPLSQSLSQWWPQPAQAKAPPGVTPGIAGFSESGRLEVTEPGPDIPDSFEPVRGYRWWSMDPAPVRKSPVLAEELWPVTPLRGARDAWVPGENIARCKAGYPPGSVHPAIQIPLLECGCGFWCYWQLQHYDLSAASFPVCGVVDGYGPVIIGEKGFRSAKARIVALAVPFTLIPVSVARRVQGSSWERAGFRGEVHYYGMDDPGKVLVPDARAGTGEQEQEQERRDLADAEAWMGIISDRISVMFPGVRVFETVAAMMAVFPPDKSYGPPVQPCPNCGKPVDDLYRHLSTECRISGIHLG